MTNEKAPLKVLVIGWVWPEPKSSAAGSHMLSLLRLFIHSGYHVTFASAAQTTPLMADLQEEGVVSQPIALNDSSFDDFVLGLNPEIVLFDRFMMEEQYGWRVEKCCPQALRILDTEDLQFLRQARHDAHKANTVDIDAYLHSDLAKREIAAIYRSDISLIISEAEMSLLTRHFRVPSSQLHYFPFVLHAADIPELFIPFSERQHCVSIGNFRHAPNWDSVLRLSRLWPQIRRRLPNAELHIYGAYMPPKAMQLHKPETGFQVRGWAEDARETLSQARLCLAPLQFGAGQKGKLLDAMVAGTPSITSAIGAEGMCDSFPWPGAIGNDDESFIAHTIELYQSPALWQAAQDNIEPILNNLYLANHREHYLMNRIQSLILGLDQHRHRHFMGALLRHHSLKSTQYMSQWIEAKNRLAKDDESC
ncbi:glycosyltransferase [Oleiphilus messinensis]|uniref:Glycosyltransferase n=1 Tax=Oleiphilus messinensis TaxID=141451 RepID=A0A1Y0IEX1_9GAMM|nr:glycosyltransferase [Oleiphilus messinensis]ARU59088.1 glycosyltransferase [Oleiphilus messinensis]